MIDMYLRAADKAALDDALRAAGLIGSEGEPVSDGACIDRIGPIPGDDRYHANVRLIEAIDTPAGLAAINIETPSSPFRVWA